MTDKQTKPLVVALPDGIGAGSDSQSGYYAHVWGPSEAITFRGFVASSAVTWFEIQHLAPRVLVSDDASGRRAKLASRRH